MFYANPLLYIQSDMHYIWKYIEKILDWRGQLGLWRMSPSKAQANVFERTLTTIDIFFIQVTSKWTRKARHGTKVYEHWQSSMQRARVKQF